MIDKKREANRKRRVLLDEAKRRMGLMRDGEIDTEFAAMENCLEIRLRFVSDPYRFRTRAPRATGSKLSRR
jgi:hypothetical protein